MDKDLIVRQSVAIEKVQGKHNALPQTRVGWIITGATGMISFFFCLAAHFDGGTVLGGLFATGIASGFSDDTVHALLYGKRLPEKFAMSNSRPLGERFQEAAADFAYRWLGFERPDDPRDGFKARFAKMCGMPEPDYEDEVLKEADDDVIPMGPAKGKPVDRMVELAPDLQMDIDDIAGKAMLICGIKRSGKTTLGVLVAEGLGTFDIPMLIPDLKGDWLSCEKTLPNAIILGKGEATEKNAKAHGYAIPDEGLQIILDITSYDDMNEVARIITSMIDGIFLWERKHPQDRRLCAVFLDEAQSFLPQDVKDSIISDTESRDMMQNAYMRVLAIGGSLGLFPVILTQRIAQVSKKIIGQPELLFLFKQTLDIDLNRYKDFTSISTEKVRALPQGKGIFVDYEGKSSIHKFHKRASSDAMSVTPKYRPVSVPVSGKRFQAEIDDFELENTRTFTETETEMQEETTQDSNDASISILREIGKRLKDGESIVEIRKSLGVNSGRAVQEINAALQFLQEYIGEE
ncbi:MAG TPA: hypothetical protein VHV10_15500 [Ktedonobacteraceae bacterium]|nr:hypothetical protein [Ktedonobacteraceae bacterium]